MMRNRQFVTVVLILAFTPALLPAQSQAKEPEHSALSHVDSFPPPAFLEGVGKSSLEITTSSPQAQRYFNQGLSLLHCFWDFEALRAFRQVVRLDPEAAMGHWGIYMALTFDRALNRKEMQAALEQAKALSEKITEQEQLYIEAALLQEKGDRKAYVRTLEHLVDRYPEDVEAKLFLARAVMAGYETDGRPREGQIYSQAILRNLLVTHPDHHGVHHYWIHAMETSSRPHEALESAHKLTLLAPASGHITHMPGHIYFQLGDYQRAYESFINSMNVELAYMREHGIDPGDAWNYFHNLDYLVANCAEDGRFEEGLKWAAVLQDLQLKGKAPRSHGSHFVSRRGHVRMIRGRMALPEFYMRFGMWQEAAEALKDLAESGSLQNDNAGLFAHRWMLYAQGMAAAEESDLEAAARAADSLDAELWRLSLEDSKPRDQIMADGSIDLLTVSSLELRGTIASLRHDHERALALLEKAAVMREEMGEGEPPRYARPIQESLAQAYSRAGRWEEARRQYQAVLDQRPRSGHALWGIAVTYMQQVDRANAIKAVEAFLEAWSHADQDLPGIVAARDWLKKMKSAP